MEYIVKLKAPQDMREADYCRGNALCEEKSGHRHAVLFSTLDEAKTVCIEHGAYGIIDVDDDECGYVWKNPDYVSESFERLKKKLSEKLMPRI